MSLWRLNKNEPFAVEGRLHQVFMLEFRLVAQEVPSFSQIMVHAQHLGHLSASVCILPSVCNMSFSYVISVLGVIQRLGNHFVETRAALKVE